MRDDMYLLQDFFRYLEGIDELPTGFHENVDIPELGPDNGVRSINLKPVRLERIIDHLEKYEYASREHVVWLFHAHTGRRPGCLYSLDLCDLHLNGNDPFIGTV